MTTTIAARINAYVGHSTTTTPKQIRRALANGNRPGAGSRILIKRQSYTPAVTQ